VVKTDKKDVIDIRNPVLIDILAGHVGVRALRIITILLDNKEIEESKIAELLNEKENLVRTMLYKLHDYKIVTFRKVKSKKNKGWFDYLWKIDKERVYDLFFTTRAQTLQKLKNRLDFEQNNQFYMCENRCMKTPFYNAFESDFVCSCGQILQYHDNSFTKYELTSYIQRLEEVLRTRNLPFPYGG
jgi:transcription initiation factor TFIIE subunit alpha